jgi:hypothetical protein
MSPSDLHMLDQAVKQAVEAQHVATIKIIELVGPWRAAELLRQVAAYLDTKGSEATHED